MKLPKVLRTIRLSKQISSLDNTQRWVQHYLDQQDAIMRETGVSKIEQLADELDDFIHRFKRRWMGKSIKGLKSENRKLLRISLQKLERMRQDVIYRKREVERDRKLLKEMEALAFPESTGRETPRDHSSWLKSPFCHSEDLLEAAQKLPVPQ